jgi:hypothetical protein
MGELDEARRLFRLVLHRPNEGQWDGAEYHLGCIESRQQNRTAAHAHFTECLKLNAGHGKAGRALNHSPFYREVAANVFEAVEPADATKVLFITFGHLAHIIQAFPVIAALRKKFRSETVWLTSPEYTSVAQASLADSVHQSKPHGLIPWNWVRDEGFTHVFFPEPAANREEWERSKLHAVDFMAHKCGVTLDTHRASLEPGSAALFEVEEFMREHALAPGLFITASWPGDDTRHWPKSNLPKVAQQIGIPLVVFAKTGEAAVPGTVRCLDKPFEVIAALIRWSCFYLGGNSGISWLATTTSTSMAVFFDPALDRRVYEGFREILSNEKPDTTEFDIYTSVTATVDHIKRSWNQSVVVSPAGA